MKKQATVEDAISIAVSAHKGQISKRGNPYVLHPLRLMLKMDSEAEKIVAVLHDVVEDTTWTINQLNEKGFSDEVLEALDCMTKRDKEEYGDFIKRLAPNSIARKVKIADLEDNINILRIPKPNSKDFKRLDKYHKWWKFLKENKL